MFSAISSWNKNNGLEPACNGNNHGINLPKRNTVASGKASEFSGGKHSIKTHIQGQLAYMAIIYNPYKTTSALITEQKSSIELQKTQSFPKGKLNVCLNAVLWNT